VGSAVALAQVYITAIVSRAVQTYQAGPHAVALFAFRLLQRSGSSMSRPARTNSKYNSSSPWRGSLPGIAFSPSDIANCTVFVDEQFERVTVLITELIDFIPEDQNQNQNRLTLIFGLLYQSRPSVAHAAKLAVVEEVKTMLNSSGELERAIVTFNALMVELEKLSFDPDQVAWLTRWCAQAIGAPHPPSQETQVSDNSAAVPDGSLDRLSVHSSLSSQSYRLPEHHDDDAQGSERSLISHEERSGSGPFFTREPGEEFSGGVSVSGIIFQHRSVDATEAETVTEAEVP
jgi:hypothetical protein